jgi:hypothetical protein
MLRTGPEVLAFVEEHGVVFQSARGRLPCLVEAIAGERIPGSWWGHAQGKRIYALLQALEDSGQVIACRLLHGKITLVHRRLWPALVRLQGELGDRASVIVQVHEPEGRHRNDVRELREVVRPEDLRRAASMSEGEAWSALAAVLDQA